MVEWYFVSKLATFKSLGRYSYVYTLNGPNDPCFDWNFGHVLEGDVIWALGIDTCFFHIHIILYDQHGIYIYISGQFITTSAEVTPNGGLVRESTPKWP